MLRRTRSATAASGLGDNTRFCARVLGSLRSILSSSLPRGRKTSSFKHTSGTTTHRLHTLICLAHKCRSCTSIGSFGGTCSSTVCMVRGAKRDLLRSCTVIRHRSGRTGSRIVFTMGCGGDAGGGGGRRDACCLFSCHRN